MPLASFHPIIADWFRRRFGMPTEVPAVPSNYVVFRDGLPVRSGAERDRERADAQPVGTPWRQAQGRI
ncbi:MAG: hypothetical protein FJ249_07035 [Nitrospira sp.]|nr:hypothetical protein [Nitrospira sp.]